MDLSHTVREETSMFPTPIRLSCILDQCSGSELTPLLSTVSLASRSESRGFLQYVTVDVFIFNISDCIIACSVEAIMCFSFEV